MSTPRISWEPPVLADLELPEIMGHIRARCPWAAAHSHASLQKYLLEEAHELLSALDEHGSAPSASSRLRVVEELGDVLYQVLFHAAVLDSPLEESPAGSASEQPQVRLRAEPVPAQTFHEVVSVLAAKLIRRHPHVFESTGPVEIAEVERRYEAVKAAERAAQQGDAVAASALPATSLPAISAGPGEQARASFASVPITLPALTRAQSVLGRIERLEITREPLVDGDAATRAEEIGRELLDLVARARHEGIDAESALRAVVSQMEHTAVERAQEAAYD